jgi:hypothetical protein
VGLCWWIEVRVLQLLFGQPNLRHYNCDDVFGIGGGEVLAFRLVG